MRRKEFFSIKIKIKDNLIKPGKRKKKLKKMIKHLEIFLIKI